MPEELSAVNTPETPEGTPRYVLQHNAIIRSINNLSATAKELTGLAMLLLPADLSSHTAAFTFTKFCRTIGHKKGGESYRLFVDAVDECMGNYISIETTSPKTGKKKWENYKWFSSSKFNEETGKATMTFMPEFAATLLELKRVYEKINLIDPDEPQSKYVLRIFEMAVSYSSLKEKDGNRSEEWYFEQSVQELRNMPSVPTDTCKSV
ncbi:hypothetical protein FACS1894200_00080 [Spirochaetia bacterium]|nr:hypothetical protein FACS1894200_00080 [Spirochaetia bacterium]